MKDYTLSKAKIAELEKFHRPLRDKHQADRVKAVIALSKGWSAAQVAEILLLMRRRPDTILTVIRKAVLRRYLMTTIPVQS